ncbi:hypothetical protein RhiirA1_446910 [Rhizophagus irregularis]|uniref:MIR domain-containing protein n=1 Tax=Rhizophagus irregularis TaxID=588596 RepID=A0A2N0QVM7_9GLOM|nr:hypothetical protein RhiirA1_446910 [Rhizophagus irregularis]
MDPQKYNGNIHPDEWISDLQTYFNIKQNLQDLININAVNINIVISLVDSTIKLPTGIDNIEKLRSSEHIPNSLWKIEFGDELATYANNSIKLQHVLSHKFLGIFYCYYDDTSSDYISEYSKSPSTNYTEVSCYNNTDHDYGYWNGDWMFNHSKLENHQGFLKSNDIINLNIKKIYANNEVEFLRSHDIQFTIGNDVFQEVVCHNERLGGNDEWCIELIHEVKIF